MKPAMMFWDHKTLIRADLVETLEITSDNGNDWWVEVSMTCGRSRGKRSPSEGHAIDELRDLHSKWTEAMRDR